MYHEENLFESVVPVLVYLPLFAVLIALIVFLIILIRRNAKESAAEHVAGITIEASIFTKRTRKKRDPNTLPYDKEYSYAATAFHYITFETRDCQRIELSVDAATYQRLSEGDTGTLTYQGSKYIDFIQEKF